MFGRSKGLVGLDIGSASVKAVELRKKGADYELVKIGMAQLGQDTVVDGAIMDALSVSSAIERIFSENKIKTKNVATAVSGPSVSAKRITVAAASEEELQNAIAYEAQQQIPFDMAEVNLSYVPLGPAATGSGMDVMVVAVKREKIRNQTDVLSQAGKTPLVVDIDAFALQNAFEVNYDAAPDQTIALLNIGASIMTINIVRGGTPLFPRDVTMGGSQYTDTLQKELELPFEDAERLKKGGEVLNVSPEAKSAHIRAVSEILLLEIRRTFDFFRQTSASDNIQQIYVAGGTARVEGLIDLLKEEFNVPVEIMNPFRRISIGEEKIDRDFVEENAPRMTIAMGLALRSFDEQ